MTGLGLREDYVAISVCIRVRVSVSLLLASSALNNAVGLFD